MQKHVLNTCFNQYLTEMFDSECVFPPGKKKKKRRNKNKSKYDRESINWHNERLIKAPWLAVHNKAKYKSFFFLIQDIKYPKKKNTP